MPSLRSSLPFGAVLISLCLMGFGCKPGWNDPLATIEKNRPEPVSPAQPVRTVATTNPSQYPITPTQAVDLVQNALKNLDDAKSFRSTIRFPSPGGFTTAVLEIDKKQGMHGTLQAPGPVINEIYLLNQKVYFRTQSAEWLDLTGTAEGQQEQQLMNSIFNVTGDDLSAKDLISDSSQVIDISQDRSGCMLVIFRPKIAKRPDDTVSMCIKNGRPTQIIASNSDGQALEARYWDYGKSFIFVAPKAKPPITVYASTSTGAVAPTSTTTETVSSTNQ